MNDAEDLLQVDLLGRSIVLRATGESPQHLDEVYNHYSIVLKQAQNVSSSTNPLDTAIIAGILLADEVVKDRKKMQDEDNTNDLNEMEALALKMISSIDKVV